MISETVDPIGPLIWKNMCLQTSFSAFIQLVYVFLKNHLKTVFCRYFIFHRKGYIHFCHPAIPLNVASPPKIIYCGYFGNYHFLAKKFLNEKYSKPPFLQKRLYWFLLPNALLPSQQPCPLIYVMVMLEYCTSKS